MWTLTKPGGQNTSQTIDIAAVISEEILGLTYCILQNITVLTLEAKYGTVDQCQT